MSGIARKRLITPVSVSSLMRAFLTVAGFLFAIVLLSGFTPIVIAIVCTMGVLMGLVSLFPVEMAIRAARSKSTMVDLAGRARAEMIAHIGCEPLVIDTYGSLTKDGKGLISASGIAWDGRSLYVLDAGEIGELPWHLVRSWEWRTQLAAQTRIYGGSGAVATAAKLQAAGDNAVARATAFIDSGFFVTVADLERPTWQFMTQDPTVLERWEEVMRQIQEGRLAERNDDGPRIARRRL